MLADQREDFPMRVSIKKTLVAAVAALGMATATASIPTPAEAQFLGAGAAAAGIAAGVGDWRLARSSARPLLILIMATDMDIHIRITGQGTVMAADPVAG